MTVKKLLLFALAITLSFVSCKTEKQVYGELISSPVPEIVEHATAATTATVTNTASTEDDIREYISVLASNSMQGRMSASPYEALAAEYIKEKFESLGLKSFNDNYYQKFPVTSVGYFDKPASGGYKGDYPSMKVETGSSQNVVAYLETNDLTHEGEYIMIGAHYDHIGTKTVGDTVLINNGADDNASGTAGLLELAKKLCSAKNLKYNVIFTAFGAEEKGLIGSRYFCNNPPVPIEKIKLMINMDMIGRMNPSNRFYISTIKPNIQLNALVDVIKKSHPDVDAVVSYDDYLRGTDHTPFYMKHVPVMSFTTGLHSAYHTPADTIGSINWKGEKQVLDFIYDLVISPAMDNCIFSFTLSAQNP